MKTKTSLIIFTSTLTFLFTTISASNILFILPIATQSHKHVFDPLIRGLANKGHQITIVVPSPSPNLPPNVHEIIPITVADFIGGFLLDPLSLRSQSKLQDLRLMQFNAKTVCEKVYQNVEFQKILSNGPGYYDLIFFNGYFNQCFFGITHYLETPYIIVTTMGAPLFISRQVGNYYPTSFVPFPFFGFSHEMSFSQRVINFIASYFVNYIYDTQNEDYEKVYRKYLGQDTPSIDVISRNVSLIFGNEHFALTYPKSNLPDIIPVGGMICKPAKPLSKELDTFLSEAPHGFIYFSLGSIIQDDDLTDDHKRIFLNVFSRLKQRVLWKWDNDTIPDLPENVRINKWLPQQDILGHPNIKLFITHGGLLSTQEAAYHGVPLIGMPIFVDQDFNMLNAENQGFGLTLEILGLTEGDFETKVRRILNEEKFTKRAKELSAIFRDGMETPLERAIFWSEYVIRHKGALHLRSAARELNFFQIHSWDVLGFLITATCILLYLIKLIVTLLFKKITKAFSTKSNNLKQKLN